MTEARQKRPWYREPMVWMLILFPGAAVIGGAITIYLAVTTSDGLVVDDYYQRGKAINLDLAREQVAAEQQLRADISFNLQDGRVQLTLSSTRHDYPDTLRLAVLHPTRPGHDQRLLLQPVADNVYRGAIEPLHNGHWYLQVETDEWRLQGRMNVPLDGPVVLSAME